MSFERLDTLLERHPPEVPEDTIQRGRARFIEAAGELERASPRKSRLVWAGLLLASVVGGAVWLTPPAPPTGVRTPTAASGAPRVRLPERPGSIELAPGAKAELTRGTVAYLSQLGPARHRVELQQGSVRLEIDPRRRTSWTVAAGSLEVSVIGTIFSVERDEVTKDVRVSVERGKVSVVSASDPGREVIVAGGQRILAKAEQIEVVNDAERSEQEPVASVGAVATSAAPSSHSLFQTRYRERDYRGALAAATSGSFEESLALWDRSSLAQLADAARLAGSPKRAEQTLERIRLRFPASRESADAAFLLGRLHADAHGAPAAAIGWFERYLAERPRGTYAQEALGRLLVASRAAGDNPKARSVASRYLEQYPQGPYARVAAAMVR